MGKNCRLITACFVMLFLVAIGKLFASAEEVALPDSPRATLARQDAPNAGQGNATGTTAADAKKAELEGQQSKRVFGFIPNFRSVSVDDNVPPLTTGEKLKIAAKDSFDYFTFVTVGGVAGYSQARGTYPEFGQGGVGYARRYWHSFTSQALGNTTTIFLLPTLTREDPRYFTLGRGTKKHRTLYAVSRLVVTRSNSGNATPNYSEIFGRGSAAAISVFYYPSRYQTFSEVSQRWGLDLGIDGGYNILKEFWPEIRYKLTRGKQ